MRIKYGHLETYQEHVGRKYESVIEKHEKYALGEDMLFECVVI